MITAVDTNIILDILIPDEPFANSSKTLLERHLSRGQLILCEVVLAELAGLFPSEKELKAFLSETGMRLVRWWARTCRKTSSPSTLGSLRSSSIRAGSPSTSLSAYAPWQKIRSKAACPSSAISKGLEMRLRSNARLVSAMSLMLSSIKRMLLAFMPLLGE